jgi:hypothetical protein
LPKSAIASRRLHHKRLSVIARHMTCTACGARDCDLTSGIIVPADGTSTISEFPDGAQ